MNLGEVVLGLAGLYFGAKTVQRSAERLAGGLSSPGAGGVPTRVIPRSQTRRALPPMLTQSSKERTAAGPLRVTTRQVRSLDDRMVVILGLAEKGKVDPRIIAWSRKELSKKCGPGWNGEQWCVKEKDRKSEIAAIFKAIRRDVRYISDVRGVDTYSDPSKTLSLHAEDCDGYAALALATLGSVGIKARAKVIETKDSARVGGGPDHIFVEAQDQFGKWHGFDASVPVQPGWQAPPSMVVRAWIYETE